MFTTDDVFLECSLYVTKYESNTSNNKRPAVTVVPLSKQTKKERGIVVPLCRWPSGFCEKQTEATVTLVGAEI